MGREQIKLVSPIFRPNIYVGVYSELQKDDSPVDLFN